MHHYKQYILHLHWVLKSFDEEYAAIDPLLLTPDWHSEAVKILGEGKASADVDDDEEEKGGRVPSDDIGMAIDGDKGERESEEEEKQVQEGEKESEHDSSSDDDEEEEKQVHEGEKGEKGEKSLIQ